MDPGKEEQENEEKMECPPGVLSHLESLERRQRRRAVLREQQERARERSELLRARAEELRQRRDSLRDQLRTMAQGGSGPPRAPRDVLRWRLRALRRLLALFPLTGISGQLSRHGLSVSLHTSYEGALLDSFHLELLEIRESQKSRECGGSGGFGGFRLGRHSIPPCVPLQGLAGRLLPHRPREFLAVLWQQLSALGHRRRQLQLLQEEFPECIRGTPCSNSLCNLLSFRCRLPGPKPGNVLEFRARLLYGDPLRSLPTAVEVSAEAGSAPAPPWLPELLRRRSLPRALRALTHGNARKTLEFPKNPGIPMGTA